MDGTQRHRRRRAPRDGDKLDALPLRFSAHMRARNLPAAGNTKLPCALGRRQGDTGRSSKPALERKNSVDRKSDQRGVDFLILQRSGFRRLSLVQPVNAPQR